jgi:hypothetical protein
MGRDRYQDENPKIIEEVWAREFYLSSFML